MGCQKSNPSTTTPKAVLIQEEIKLIEGGIAENTRKLYISGLAKFYEYRRNTGEPLLWPATTQQVRAFIAFLLVKKKSPTYATGIAYHHKINNLTDPTNNFVVRKMLEGFKRLKPQKDTRVPITIDMLKKIIEHSKFTCANPYEVSLFKSAVLTGYFGLLRISEYTSESKRNNSHAVQINDVLRNFDGSISIVIKTSKTDQLGKGTVITFEPCNTHTICPVRALQQYLVSFRPNLKGPLFIHSNGTPLTRFQF